MRPSHGGHATEGTISHPNRAALRDFKPAYVGSGSFASIGHQPTVRLAPEFGHVRPLSHSLRCANRVLTRRRERLHSALLNCFGSARGGKKFDQSFGTFNVS